MKFRASILQSGQNTIGIDVPEVTVTALGQGRVANRGTLSTTEKVGWAINGLLIAFLLVDGIMKLFKAETSIEGTIDLGYPESTVIWIGLTLVVCTVLYAIPRTAVLGAILLTGYFGGATATRLEDPWLLFPIGIGVLVWVGLALRDAGTRTFLEQNLVRR